MVYHKKFSSTVHSFAAYMRTRGVVLMAKLHIVTNVTVPTPIAASRGRLLISSSSSHLCADPFLRASSTRRLHCHQRLLSVCFHPSPLEVLPPLRQLSHPPEPQPCSALEIFPCCLFVDRFQPQSLCPLPLRLVSPSSSLTIPKHA